MPVDQRRRRPQVDGIPQNRDEATVAILTELDTLATRLAELEQERDALYARRRELYVRGRGMKPPVSGAAMARAARVSDAALVLSARRLAG